MVIPQIFCIKLSQSLKQWPLWNNLKIASCHCWQNNHCYLILLARNILPGSQHFSKKACCQVLAQCGGAIMAAALALGLSGSDRWYDDGNGVQENITTLHYNYWNTIGPTSQAWRPRTLPRSSCSPSSPFWSSWVLGFHQLDPVWVVGPTVGAWVTWVWPAVGRAAAQAAWPRGWPTLPASPSIGVPSTRPGLLGPLLLPTGVNWEWH